jgi:hypothetical protein
VLGRRVMTTCVLTRACCIIQQTYHNYPRGSRHTYAGRVRLMRVESDLCKKHVSRFRRLDSSSKLAPHRVGLRQVLRPWDLSLARRLLHTQHSREALQHFTPHLKHLQPFTLSGQGAKRMYGRACERFAWRALRDACEHRKCERANDTIITVIIERKCIQS